jgi:hypothetical protein
VIRECGCSREAPPERHRKPTSTSPRPRRLLVDARPALRRGGRRAGGATALVKQVAFWSHRWVTDLEAVKSSAPPRPEAICRRLARRGAPLFGFLAYGVLYFFVVVNTAMLGALFLALILLERAGASAGSIGSSVLFSIVVAAAGLLSAWPFVRWARRRRRQWQDLVRDGTLLDGHVTAARRATFRGSPLTTGIVAVELAGSTRKLLISFGGHSDEFVVGATRPVLAHPAFRFAFGFPLADRAIAGRWRRSR